MNRSALPAIFNPEDLNALEMALRDPGAPRRNRDRHHHGPAQGGQHPARVPLPRRRPGRPADRPQVRRRRHAGHFLRPAAARSRSSARSISSSAAARPSTATPPRSARRLAEKLGIPQITYAESDRRARGRQDHRPARPRLRLRDRALHAARACSPSSARPTRRGPASVRRRIERKLAAAPERVRRPPRAVARVRDRRGPRGVPGRARPEDPRLDGRGHRRRPRSSIGLAGSPTQVHKINFVVLESTESKTIPPTPEGNRGDDRRNWSTNTSSGRRDDDRAERASGYSSSRPTARSPTSASS